MKFLLPIEFDETNDADWKQKLSLAARLALQIGIVKDVLIAEAYRSLPAIQGQYLLQRYDFLKFEKERNRQRLQPNGGKAYHNHHKENTIAQRKASVATRPYDRLATIPLTTIFSNLGKVIEVCGQKVAVKSKRYKCYARNIICIRCGIEGHYFAAEKQISQLTDRYHLNLYHKTLEGKEIMMTVDHRIPLSRGGPDNVSNLQTMCIRCNGAKGNMTEEEWEIFEKSKKLV